MLSNLKFDQPLYIFITILTIIFCSLFIDVIIGEKIFGTTDSLSPIAIKEGITISENNSDKYPLWLPWIFSGIPSVHSFQNLSEYYIPNLFIKFLYLIGFPNFINYIFHFLLAGLGVFLLLKSLNIDNFSSIFGGFSFAMMPYITTMVVHGHGSQMMTSAWIPWVIWSILRLYDRANISNIGILGLIIGFQLQRGHVQIAYYSWLAAGLLIVMLVFNSNNKQIRWILYSFVGLLLGLLMAMWIYLPALNYTPFSIRGASVDGGTGFQYATSWSFSFGEMTTFLIPSYYGFGGGTYWGSMPFTDYPNYMGIIVLIFSIIGSFFYNKKIKWYFIATALISLLLSFGKNFFLYEIFYNYLPFFNKFRVPVMLLILTQFSISVLAALGLAITLKLLSKQKIKNNLFRVISVPTLILFIIFVLRFFCLDSPGSFPAYPNPNNTNTSIKVSSFINNFSDIITEYEKQGYSKDQVVSQIISQYFPDDYRNAVDNDRINFIDDELKYIIIYILVLLLLFYLYSNKIIDYKIFSIVIISISVIDLGIIDSKIINTHNKTYQASSMIDKTIKLNYLEEDDIIRFLKKDDTSFRILPLGSLASENRWSAFHIESIEGYHPAKLFNYNQLKDEVGWFEKNNGKLVDFRDGILRMLNVKYIVALGEPSPDAVFSGQIFHNGRNQSANIFLFDNFIPRAFFVNDLQEVDYSQQLSMMTMKDFDPVKISFIDHKPKDIKYSNDSSIKISSSNDKIELDIITSTNQFLVLSEIFYPNGWMITSHPEWEIYNVNSILRGFYVPKGEHNIVMEFVPIDTYYGSIISWFSIIILVIFAFSKSIFQLAKYATIK